MSWQGGWQKSEMVRYYAQCLAQHGHTITPGHISMDASVYVADSRQQALQEAGPYMLYFPRNLFSHGNISNVERQTQSGYREEADYDYIRPEHWEGFLRGLQGLRRTTLADLESNERLSWGSPEQVRDALIELAESLGAGTLMLNFNQGAMPHDMFVRNLQRFGTEVLPAIQAHAVTTVPIT